MMHGRSYVEGSIEAMQTDARLSIEPCCVLTLQHPTKHSVLLYSFLV